MGNSFFPRALLYKEWLQKRWIAIGAFLVICPAVFFETLTPLTDPAHPYFTVTSSTGTVQHVDVVVNTFTWYCNQLVGHLSTGWWATIVVVGFALFSLWSERNHEVWWFTLSAPVTKRQVLRVKYTVDLSIIVAIFTLLAVCLAVLDWVIGVHYPLFGIVRWWVSEIAIQSSMYALALLLSTLIGNVIAVALLTFGIANIPMYAGIPLIHGLGANWVVFDEPSKYTIPLSWQLMWLITHLSPLNWFSIDLSQARTSYWPYFLWFLVFTLLACATAERIYEQLANERLSYFFGFKWLRHPIAFALSGVVACVVVRESTAWGRFATEAEWVVVITVILWAAFTVAHRQIVKLRRV